MPSDESQVAKNRAVMSATNIRDKRKALVDKNMERLFVTCHAEGDNDDEAICECVSNWISEKQFEQLEGDTAHAAVYCNDLKMEIDKALAELQDLRAPVFKDVEAQRALTGDKSSGFYTVTSSQVKHVDPTKFNNDESDENAAAKAREDAALAATLSNPQHTTHNDELAFSTSTRAPAAGHIADKNKNEFSMLKFILELGAAGTITSYKKTQILQMLNKCEAMLLDLPPKVKVENEWVMDSAKSGRTAKETIEAAIAAFIYSVDAKDCDCLTVKECLQRQLEDSVNGQGKHRSDPKPPQNTTMLGWNGSHWAMMNTTLRVGCDPEFMKTLNAKEKKQMHDIIKFFAPLRERLNVGLKIFPREPRVVFRGITVPVAHKYSLGSTIQFAPFTSTSLEGEQAMRFMSKGGTYFVISTHSGAMIADFSHYPEQAEALMRTNREFIVTAKMSGTLQQILGNDFDVIFMSETDSPLDDKAKIHQLVAGQQTTRFVYAGYQKTYVEGRVSQEIPAVDSKKKPFPLYKATAHFVNGLSLPYMLLLGSGGSGKTSALIGCLCHLMSLQTRKERPLFPIFVSLPGVGQALHTAGGLDKHIQEQLRLSSEAFELVLTETRVVLLLDSLDEVPLQEETKGSILSQKLLELNPWASRAKVILSSRTEFLDAEQQMYDTALHSDGRKTLVYHVWPFNEEDREQFMKQAASDRIEELARREANEQYKELSDTFQLTDDELSHPCVLRIATDVVANTDNNASTRLQNLYTLYESFVSTSLAKANEKLTKELVKRVISVLQLIAVDMAKAKRWQMAVREVRKRLHNALFSDPANPCPLTITELLKAIPSRCEDIYNDEALWTFWHKTVGEHLVAQAMVQKVVAEDDITTDLENDHPVIAEMLNHSRLNVHKFASETESIPETIKRVCDLDNVEKIDMSRVEVKGENVDVNEWIAEQLKTLDPGPNRKKLSFVFPCFTELKALKSFTLPASCSGKVSLVMANSFPSVTSVCENFNITNIVSVVLPEFPSLKMIANGFFSGNKELQRIKGVNLKVRKIGNDFLSKTSAKEIVLQHFDSLTTIGDNFLSQSSAAECVLLTHFGKVGTLGAECLSNSSVNVFEMQQFTSLTTVGRNFLNDSAIDKIVMQHMNAIENLKFFHTIKAKEVYLHHFLAAKTFPEAFMKDTAQERLVMEYFSGLTILPDGFLSGCVSKHVTLKHFGALAKIGNNFMAQSNIDTISLECLDANTLQSIQNKFLMHCTATKVLLPEFPSVTMIGDDFGVSSKIQSISLPVFPAVETLGDNFFADSSALSRVELPQYGFPQLKTIGNCFFGFRYDTVSSSFSTVSLPLFPHVETIGDDFMVNATSSLSKLEFRNQAGTFPVLRRLGKHFIATTTNKKADESQLTSITLPHFPHLDIVGEDFLANQPRLAAVDFDDKYFKRIDLRPARFCHGTKLFATPSRWSGSFSIGANQLMHMPAPLREAVKMENVSVINLTDLNRNGLKAQEWCEKYLVPISVSKPLHFNLPPFKDTDLSFDVTFDDSFQEHVLLNMTQCFPDVTRISTFKITNVFNLKAPMFEKCESMTGELLFSNVNIVSFPPEGFPKLTKIDSKCIEKIIKVAVLEMPAFASLEDVGLSNFRNLVADKRISFPPGAFAKVKQSPSRFLSTVEAAVVELPVFSSLETISDCFLSRLVAAEQLVIPSDAFPALKKLGRDCMSFVRAPLLEMPLFPSLEEVFIGAMELVKVDQLVCHPNTFPKLKKVGSLLRGVEVSGSAQMPKFAWLEEIEFNLFETLDVGDELSFPPDAFPKLKKLRKSGSSFMKKIKAPKAKLPIFASLEEVGAGALKTIDVDKITFPPGAFPKHEELRQNFAS